MRNEAKGTVRRVKLRRPALGFLTILAGINFSGCKLWGVSNFYTRGRRANGSSLTHTNDSAFRGSDIRPRAGCDCHA